MAPTYKSVGRVLTDQGQNAAGLTMLFSLPAIWMAWSETVLLTILSISVGAGALYCVLAFLGEYLFDAYRPAAFRTVAPRLSEGAAEELARLAPFVHHNRLTPSAAVRRVLERLRRESQSDR